MRIYTAGFSLLLVILFFPAIPVFSVSGISSAVRLDFIFSFLLLFLSFLDSGFRGSISSGLKTFILILIVLIYLIVSSNVAVGLAQLIIYASLYSAYYIGNRVQINRRLTHLRWLFYLLAVNCLVHIAFHFFNFNSIILTHTNGLGQQENDVVFGLFGTSKMPFQFILYVAALFYLLFTFRWKLGFLAYFIFFIALVAAATSESRIGFVALIFGLYVSFGSIKYLPLAIILIPFVFISGLLTDKVASVLTLDVASLGQDPSLSMRLINFENFVNWLSLERIIFGGGGFAHLQFTNTYGEAGALDMFYIRIIAEFGIIWTTAALLFLLYRASRIIMLSARGRSLAIGWIVFIGLYSLVNEGVISSRSGHLIMFLSGVIFTANRNLGMALEGGIKYLSENKTA